MSFGDSREHSANGGNAEHTHNRSLNRSRISIGSWRSKWLRSWPANN